MMFGEKTGAAESYAIIDRALAAGINFLDTANVYGRGQSEKIVGEALKRNGRRDQVVLATKVHGRMDDDDPNMRGTSRRHIIQQCDASLKRLQTDYIDLYQVHRPQPDVPIDETLRALDDLIKAGKVRYIGTSTYAAWQVVEALWVSKELGLNRFVSEQPPYNILDRRVERELLPMARTYGLAIMLWSPLAGGLLTGKYERDKKPPADSRYFKHEESSWLSKRWKDNVFEVLDHLKHLADAKGCPLAQFALAWCLSQPGVTSPIIGPRTMAQLEDHLGALKVSITPEDAKTVDKLVAPGTFVSSFYDANFGPHPFRI